MDGIWVRLKRFGTLRDQILSFFSANTKGFAIDIRKRPSIIFLHPRTSNKPAKSNLQAKANSIDLLKLDIHEKERLSHLPPKMVCVLLSLVEKLGKSFTDVPKFVLRQVSKS
ncbi:hypothetical protein AVEN_28829-1 [Araneus ventricosus]|uniref:Uncharacterized protein n=1 Tax=Araneus ventricosus TaxID=182803 RepID=A0A4Y2NUD4_ARAVE|nr:hypothetical protein AVEN_28829-1 [Araneus ventricosus]